MLDDYRVCFADREFECVDKGFGINEHVDVVVRPEDIKLVRDNDSLLQGVVKSVIFKGVHYEMQVCGMNGYNWIVHSTSMEPVDTKVGLSIQPFDIQIMKKVPTT
jgi:spermidine/putrescine transport system ATP-binding protein